MVLFLQVGALGALVACWLATALLAAGAVAAADACQQPAAALAHHAPTDLPRDVSTARSPGRLTVKWRRYERPVCVTGYPLWVPCSTRTKRTIGLKFL